MKALISYEILSISYEMLSIIYGSFFVLFRVFEERSEYIYVID